MCCLRKSGGEKVGTVHTRQIMNVYGRCIVFSLLNTETKSQFMCIQSTQTFALKAHFMHYYNNNIIMPNRYGKRFVLDRL